jgi:hypothetical protein
MINWDDAEKVLSVCSRDKYEKDNIERGYEKVKVKQTNSVALSRRANYTDWATAACRRNLVPTYVDRGVSHGQRSGSLTVVKLSFLDRSRYFSFKNSSFTLTRFEWTPFQNH